MLLPVESTLFRGEIFRVIQGPGACFSKDPKLFGRISGDIILLVSLKRRRLEARNFAVILDFIPFTTYEKTSFTEYAGRSFTNGFSGPKSFRKFRETAPRCALRVKLLNSFPQPGFLPSLTEPREVFLVCADVWLKRASEVKRQLLDSARIAYVLFYRLWGLMTY